MKKKFVKNIRTKATIARPMPIDEEVLYDGGAMITETDIAGVITFANRKFIEMTGYSREELIGSPHNINRHPDMPRAAFKEMWDAVSSGEFWQGIVKNLCKNGKYYWVDVWVQAKHDEEGKHIGYIAGRKVPHPDDIKRVRKLYKELINEQISGVESTISTENSLSMDEFLDVIQQEKKRIFSCSSYVKELVHNIDTSIQSNLLGSQALFCASVSSEAKKVSNLKVEEKLFSNIENSYKLIFSHYQQIDKIYNTQEEISNSNKIVAKGSYTKMTNEIQELLVHLDALEKECLNSMFT